MTDIQTDNAKKQFRIANQRLFLTYETHVDKEVFREWFKTNVREPKVLYIAHETGESGYKHSHILVDFGKAFQSTNPRRFDYDNKHPNIQKVGKSKTDWNKLLNYIRKEDKEVEIIMDDKQYEEPCFAAKIWDMDNLQDALRTVTKPSEALGTIAMYAHKPLPKVKRIIKEDQLYEWQKELREELEGEPDDRKVIWLVDKQGGCGKTQFGRFLMYHEKEKYYMVMQAGGIRDFATIYKSAVEGGWEGHCMIFNLTRDDKEHAIYKPIEACKDGIITTTKYQGKTCFMDPCHVVVFANWYPDRHKLSLDRWDVREIEEGKVRPITLNELAAQNKRDILEQE